MEPLMLPMKTMLPLDLRSICCCLVSYMFFFFFFFIFPFSFFCFQLHPRISGTCLFSHLIRG